MNLVNGRGHITGDALVRDPRVRVVSFTGGTNTGRLIAAAAVPQLKRVDLELGGKSANIITASAVLDDAVDRAFWFSGKLLTVSLSNLSHEPARFALATRLIRSPKWVLSPMPLTINARSHSSKSPSPAVPSYSLVGSAHRCLIRATTLSLRRCL